MINELFNVTSLDSKSGEHGMLTGGWRAIGTFGITDATDEATAFNFSFDSLSGRGDIYQGFDCHDTAHFKGISVTDNISASSRLNLTFDTSTGFGLFDKRVDFEDGLNSNGDIMIDGVTAIGGIKSGSFSVDDDDIHTENFNYPLSLNFFEVKIHISSVSKDSFLELRVMKSGSVFLAEIGNVYGEEFPIYVQYDVVESANNQKHSVKFIGIGTGDTLNYSYKSTKPFNNL